MVVIITGRIGIGKTMVCRRVSRLLQERGYTCGGVVSYKVEEGGIIVEDIGTGETGVLASRDSIHHGPRVGQYYFSTAGIALGIKAIDRGAASDLLVVDELGPLELSGGGFIKALDLLREREVKHCILVIRQQLVDSFQPHLDGAPLIFETTIENRDQLPQTIVSVMADKLPKKAVI